MRSFVILFLIFGLMPIWKNGKFKYLLLTHFILSVGFIFGIIVSFFFINDVIQENNLSSVVSLSFLFSAIFTHLIVLLQAFVYRSKQIKLFEIFHNVDKLFRNKLQSHNLYAREKRQLFRQLSIILSILLTIKICLIISVASYAIFWYHCLYSIFIIRVTCIQIIYFVNLLKNRLVLVDEKLKEIIIGQSIANNGISIYSDKQALRQNIIFILDNSYSKCTIYERLIYLKRVYGKLYEICEVINQAFGWSLLAITAQGFIDFTGCSYWTFLALEQTNQSFYKVTFNIYLLVPTVVILTAMASYCSSCAQMVICILL